MTTPVVLFVMAAATSLGLGAAAIARRPRGVVRWSFALGMLGFAVESVSALILVVLTEAPDDRLMWLKATNVAGLLLLIPWGVFVAAFTRRGGPGLSGRLRAGLGLGAATLTASAVAVALLPAFEVSEIAGRSTPRQSRGSGGWR
jgi:hypothetical protein